MLTKRFQFPSLLHPDEHAFEICEDSTHFWDTAYRHGPILSLGAGVYDTYGDGMVQHSPLYSAGQGHFTDFCLSLTQHLLDHPEAEISSTHLFRHDLSDTVLNFLAGIRHNSEKRTWFSITDLKVSASTSKQYDKRWMMVPDYVDGSVAGAYYLWHMGNDRPVMSWLELYAMQDRFWLALCHHRASGADWESKITKWHEELKGDHMQALRGLRTVIAAREKLENARRIFDSAMYNTRQALEPATKPTPEPALEPATVAALEHASTEAEPVLA
jgi:hypothetical protein